ncbi:MAG: dockerin type I domain-containing protein [Planctomycetota bacterium]
MSRKNATTLKRCLTIQKMEARQLLAADIPTGATPVDVAEFLLGSVTVTPVFFESDGSIDESTEDWDSQEIDDVLAKIQESLDWWTDLLATKTNRHSLTFTIDDTYARNPVETGFEPINRSSQTNTQYVGAWLTDLGYGNAGSLDRAIRLFNDDQRIAHGTNWAFTIVVVDSTNDDNDFFAPGEFSGAFAYPGGMYYVVPSERPVWTYAHELGHIFWARDEYPGGSTWTDQRGYYNAQTLNAADNPNATQQISIMRGNSVAQAAYDQLFSPEETLALLGWQDSDGDGVFDVLDVPLELNVFGTFDPIESELQLIGSASVDFLPNANSSGNQTDITLAKVSELQYRIDGGDWQTLLSPNAASFDFDVSIPISEPFSLFEVRAIDTNTGITSEVYEGDQTIPAFSGLGGVYAFYDEDTSGVREGSESLLAGTQFSIEAVDGSLPVQMVQSSDQPFGLIQTVDGLTFSTEGEFSDGNVSVLLATDSSLGMVFQTRDPFRSTSVDRWNDNRKLVVESDQPTGRVVVDVISQGSFSPGLEAGVYARIDAFDQDGNLIERVTSDPLAEGAHQVAIEDRTGRISKVVIYGQAGTDILVSGITFGHQEMASDGSAGGMILEDLPDGRYVVRPTTPNLIYQLPSEFEVDVQAGNLGAIAIPAIRVNSPRYNADEPGDVNGDEDVTPRDALVIINDLARNGSRTFTAEESEGTSIDVSNDGMVSPLDALQVINQIARGEGEGEGISFSGRIGTDLDSGSIDSAFGGGGDFFGFGGSSGSSTSGDSDEGDGDSAWNLF